MNGMNMEPTWRSHTTKSSLSCSPTSSCLHRKSTKPPTMLPPSCIGRKLWYWLWAVQTCQVVLYKARRPRKTLSRLGGKENYNESHAILWIDGC